MRYQLLTIVTVAALTLATAAPALARQREGCPPEAQNILEYVAGITVPCVPVDADEDGQITSRDALWILRGLE